jgi:tetratricopeptide (TPR) repeat protein
LDSLEQFDAAHSAAQECLKLFRTVEDRQGEVDGLLWLAWESSNPTEKLALIQQALALAQSLGDVPRQADALGQLGWLDQSNKFVHWEKAIGLTRQLGDWLRLANRLSTMAFFLILDGDINSAQKHLDEANALYQRLNPKQARTKLLSAYGQIALIQGDFETARAYYQENARICDEFGNRLEYLWSRVHLGYIALCEGSLTEARDIFVETVQDFQKDKNIIGVVFALEGMAGLDIAVGKPGGAARLIGWSDAAREKISDKRPLLEQADVDKIIAACQAKMGETAFSDAYEEGQKISMDEAVALALDEK